MGGQVPIPNDWDEQVDGWTNLILCVPNSPKWVSIYRGLCYDLTFWNSWDRNTGLINAAKAVALEVYETMANCDLTIELARIATALEILSGPTIGTRTGSGCCCTGAGSGFAPASEPGVEGAGPPTNVGDIEWTEPPGAPQGGSGGLPEYYSRKCKVANGIHENIKTWIDFLISTWVAEAGINIYLALFGAAIGELLTPIPILDGVAGAIVGYLLGIVIVLATNQQVDLDVIKTYLNNNEQDLVCALYNSTGAADAIANYLGVLSNAGMSLANMALISAMLVVDAANFLFFQNDAYIEAKIASYVPPVSCTLCECTETHIYGVADLSVGLHTWTSEHRTVTPTELIYFCRCSEGGKQIRVKFLAINGWTDAGPQYIDWRLWSTCPGSEPVGDVLHSQTIPPDLNVEYVFNQLIFWSATPFSVDVEVLGEV